MDVNIHPRVPHYPTINSNLLLNQPIAPNNGIAAAFSIAQNALIEVHRVLMQSQNAITLGHTLAQRYPNQGQFLNNPMTTPVQLQATPCQPITQKFQNLTQQVPPTGIQRNNRRRPRENKNPTPCHACKTRKRRCKRILSPANICERCAEVGLLECRPPPIPRPITNTQIDTFQMASTPMIKNFDHVDKREETDIMTFNGSVNAQREDSHTARYLEPVAEERIKAWRVSQSSL